MKLENGFTVNTSIKEAWKAMNDLERVTPCLSGCGSRSRSATSTRGS